MPDTLFTTGPTRQRIMYRHHQTIHKWRTDLTEGAVYTYGEGHNQ